MGLGIMWGFLGKFEGNFGKNLDFLVEVWIKLRVWAGVRTMCPHPLISPFMSGNDNIKMNRYS